MARNQAKIDAISETFSQANKSYRENNISKAKLVSCKSTEPACAQARESAAVTEKVETAKSNDHSFNETFLETLKSNRVERK